MALEITVKNSGEFEELMMNQDKEYELDGLIFTPEGEYKNVSKNNRSWDDNRKRSSNS